MSKPKEFDCVEMKWEAQRKLAEKYAGLSDEEARRRQWQEILADPVLGPFVSELLDRQKRAEQQ